MYGWILKVVHFSYVWLEFILRCNSIQSYNVNARDEVALMSESETHV